VIEGLHGGNEMSLLGSDEDKFVSSPMKIEKIELDNVHFRDLEGSLFDRTRCWTSTFGNVEILRILKLVRELERIVELSSFRRGE
jgi:hypothetical protein